MGQSLPYETSALAALGVFDPADERRSWVTERTASAAHGVVDPEGLRALPVAEEEA